MAISRTNEKYIHILENKDEQTMFIYLEKVLPDEIYQQLWKELLKCQDWKQGHTKSGQVIDREQMWYQHDGKNFCPEWKTNFSRWKSHKYTSILKNVEKYIEERVNQVIPNSIDAVNYNSILINRYRSGKQFIPAHRDNPISFGTYPTIALLSLGCEREFEILGKNCNYPYTLKDNSLLIMAGASQKYYKHQLLPDDKITKERYSLSFREFLL